MKPVVVTFVDEKMMSIAAEQSENINQFGLKHEIISIPEVKEYDTALWLHLVDLTIDAINKHGKIMRLDAEVRIHKPLPQNWLDNDNVFFQSYPLVKKPYFIALNTGQIILGKSGLEFCRTLKECMLALIPPDGNTYLEGRGEHIEDEVPSAIAIRLSRVNYVQEYLKMDRMNDKPCAANRGTWVEDSTILTHPSIHNWEYAGSGLQPVDQVTNMTVVLNHFSGDARLAMLIINLMMERNDGLIWKKLAEDMGNGWFRAGGWYFEPRSGMCAPEQYWPNSLRRLDHLSKYIKIW